MPVRWFARLLLLAGLAALAVPSAVGQGGGAADKVTYRDPDGKVVAADVTDLKESPGGVVGKAAGKTISVPANDIVRIDYGTLPGVQKGEQLKALAVEEAGDPAKAQAEYADLLRKVGPTAAEKTKRALAFREAVWHAKLADAKTGDDFRTEAARVADKLTQLFKASKKTWEGWPAARTAARLQQELGEFAKAAALLGELAAVPDLPRDLRYDARLAEAAALIRAGQASVAEGSLAQLAADKDLPAGPLRERAAVLQAAARVPWPKPGQTASPNVAEALAKLREAVDAAKEPSAKAVGYNFLGDAHAALGQLRDAMWSYLWVDAVYNQDVEERVLAVRKLADLFDRMGEGEKGRSAEFREKLPRVRNPG